MRYTLRLALLAAAFAAGTAAFGWWTVPLLGVVWPVVAGHGDVRPAATAAFAAGAGWAALLLWGAVRGPVAELAPKIGGAIGLPGLVLVFATVAYPIVLAGSGAAATQWVIDFARRDR